MIKKYFVIYAVIFGGVLGISLLSPRDEVLTYDQTNIIEDETQNIKTGPEIATTPLQPTPPVSVPKSNNNPLTNIVPPSPAPVSKPAPQPSAPVPTPIPTPAPVTPIIPTAPNPIVPSPLPNPIQPTPVLVPLPLPVPTPQPISMDKDDDIDNDKGGDNGDDDMEFERRNRDSTKEDETSRLGRIIDRLQEGGRRVKDATNNVVDEVKNTKVKFVKE